MFARILGLALIATVAVAADAELPRVPSDAIAFTPRYPLWTDGMSKRRWLHLPAGTAIDKSDADAWEFPRGTRAWKEFRRDGKPVETRLIERLADGSWRYLTYAWNAQGTEATLAPEEGIPERGIPSRADCLACHEGAPVPILGYSAVQLSTELPAALGYLHGNCGHCHNGNDAAPPVNLRLEQTGTSGDVAAAWRSLAEQGTQYGRGAAPVTPGAAADSVLVARMRSRAPADQMPPLGTRLSDPEGLALVERWIDSLKPSQEHSR